MHHPPVHAVSTSFVQKSPLQPWKTRKSREGGSTTPWPRVTWYQACHFQVLLCSSARLRGNDPKQKGKGPSTRIQPSPDGLLPCPTKYSNRSRKVRVGLRPCAEFSSAKQIDALFETSEYTQTQTCMVLGEYSCLAQVSSFNIAPYRGRRIDQNWRSIAHDPLAVRRSTCLSKLGTTTNRSPKALESRNDINDHCPGTSPAAGVSLDRLYRPAAHATSGGQPRCEMRCTRTGTGNADCNCW